MAKTSWLPQDPAAADQNTPTPLQSDLLVEREIAGGELHVFSIQVPAHQFVRISVDQLGSVLNAKLTAPGGDKLLEGTTPNALSDISRFSFISEKAGEYRLEISQVRRETPRRKYSIKIEERREAKADDQDRTAADRLVMEAGSLIAAMSAGNLKAASEKYRAALELFRRVGALYETAQTLLSLGSIFNNLSQKTLALDYYEQSLPIWRTLKDRRKEAQTLSALGWTYFGSGDFSKAEENYNKALPIRRELKDLRGQAQTLTTLGQVYDALGEPQLAIDNYTQGLQLARQAGDQIQQAFALNNFGYMYANLGEYQKGLNCLAEAVSLWKETGNRYGEADALNGTGIIYDRLGDFEKGLDYYNQALKIWRYLGYRGGEADALNNIGVGTLNRAQSQGTNESLKTALDYLNQALAIRRSIGQGLGEHDTLVSIGVVYQYWGQTEKALEYFKEVLAKDPNNPFALHNTGFNYFLVSDYPHAIEYFNRALATFRERGMREGEALTLKLLAASQEDIGELVEARENARKAIEIVESSHARVASPEMRMLHRGLTASYPLVLIDVLSRMHRLHPNDGYDREAFEVSERARARGLLEMLLQARVDLSKDVEPTALARERSLELQLNAKEQYRTRLIGTKGREAELRLVENEIASLATQYREARSILLAGNPKYAALTEPTTLTVKETQALIDDDTIFLEYRLGNQKSYLWAISSKSFEMHVLPGRDSIQTEARRVYDLLTARNSHQPAETAPQKAARIARADEEFASAASNLSQTLLGPISSTLGKKRMVVVSEGLLQYIPFGALPTPLNNTGGNMSTVRGLPLMVEHEVVNLPSVSVLGILRRDSNKRQPATKTVAVIADPVYSSDDPRMKPSSPATTVSLNRIPDSPSGSSTGPKESESQTPRYGRLRFSRDEAQNIIAFAPKASTFEALDFAASKATVTTSDLAQYRILHFATHGLLDSERPELSGLALSLIAEDGQSLDGYLRLHDIYKLKLNADLVVLSGCQTALGKDLKGEGLIGLTRGFMYAGVPRVIASLWSVDDRATSELMKRFYRGVLIDGLRPAAALRAAQNSLFSERGWSSPYYWAPFTLQGEWK